MRIQDVELHIAGVVRRGSGGRSTQPAYAKDHASALGDDEAVVPREVVLQLGHQPLPPIKPLEDEVLEPIRQIWGCLEEANDVL